MFTPLHDVKVVDLSQIISGPYCTYLLALMGAQVTKLEPPGEGDWSRNNGEDEALNRQRMGLFFLPQNAGKRSVTVDIKQAAGQELVRRLVADADVFVENMRPGAAARAGLGWEQLREVNPRLVYCSISGFGQVGPLSRRPAFDQVIQGMSGLMSMIGEPDGPPLKVGAPIVDYATGLYAAFAVAAALPQARTSGRGVQLDVAMLDTALSLLSASVVGFLDGGVLPRQIGNDAPSGNPSAGAFATADGLLLIAANNERQTAALLQALSRQDLLADPRFADPAERRRNKAAYRTELLRTLAGLPASAWEERLNDAGIPAVRVRDLPEILAEAHLAQRPFAHPLAAPGIERTLSLPGAAFRADGEAVRPTAPPPRLGEDTEAVLRELGYGEAQIADLRRDGAI